MNVVLFSAQLMISFLASGYAEYYRNIQTVVEFHSITPYIAISRISLLKV